MGTLGGYLKRMALDAIVLVVCQVVAASSQQWVVTSIRPYFSSELILLTTSSTHKSPCRLNFSGLGFFTWVEDCV